MLDSERNAAVSPTFVSIAVPYAERLAVRRPGSSRRSHSGEPKRLYPVTSRKTCPVKIAAEAPPAGPTRLPSIGLCRHKGSSASASNRAVLIALTGRYDASLAGRSRRGFKWSRRAPEPGEVTPCRCPPFVRVLGE